MNKLLNKFYFFITYLVPVFVIAGIIFYLSNQPGLKSNLINPLEIILRKGAHFLEYGLLSLFLWRLFAIGYRFIVRKAFWVSLTLAVIYAGLDEVHQVIVPRRSGRLVDVLIDFLGAFITLQVLAFLVTRQKKELIKILGALFIFLAIVGGMVWHEYEKLKESFQPSNTIVLEENQVKTESKIDKLSALEEKVVSDIKTSKTGENDNDIVESNIIEVNKLPQDVYWNVPFTTQSPYSKWDEVHEEACEETSLIMLKYYVKGKSLSRRKAEREIQKVVKYQIEKYGDFNDTDIKTTKEIGEKYLGLNNLKIIEDFTIVDLKKELAQGNIILVPTAGRELKNPHFKVPGPLYHNLVIIGYYGLRKTFITNDPGTRKGKGYEYDQQVLYDAIHDFPGDVNKILDGEKRALVLTVNDEE